MNKVLRSPVAHPPRELLAGKHSLDVEEDEEDDVPELVPNLNWSEDQVSNEHFELAREKLRDLLLADPVLREKAEVFVRALVEKAQEEALARQDDDQVFEEEDDDGEASRERRTPKNDSSDDSRARQEFLERLPSFDGINRVLNVVSGGVTRAFHRVVVCGENFWRNRRRRT
ncbi:unnamed protein product [Notodromas monacha]|uniref:Uncharacterized protein n=1 Tax=Notodromas monacha TaxID=399045 RepID=A0A7R9GEY7_9CRUS|nr:unnamed protein product [Notodromas monacha]CAG0918757.1 unnamed protein product [Notodromas monacha]